MKVTYSQPCVGYPAARVEEGHSTWDHNNWSIRLRCPSSNGGFSRGSPEVPEWFVSEMIEFALQRGRLTPFDLADAIHGSGKIMEVLEELLSFIKPK